MIIKDVIWGEFDTEDAIIKEVINSKSMQRLKGIAQYGLPYRLYPLKGFNRYEHSVGVYLLLKKLNASLEEQVAGLLHDVSHTAFSHLIDWAIGNREKEDYQDKMHEKFIFSSDIPKTLEKYGFEAKRIVEHKNYSLLERPAPDLCADRIDYSIREFSCWAAPNAVSTCANSLVNYNERIVFSSKESANLFAINYLKCQREHWGGAEWMLRWDIFSNLLKYSLENKIINLDDFYCDDEHVINKLKNSGDKSADTVVEVLGNNLEFEKVNANDDIYLKKKLRHVDPEYLENGRIYRLSEASEEFSKYLEEQKRINEKGIKIKLISKT